MNLTGIKHKSLPRGKGRALPLIFVMLIVALIGAIGAWWLSRVKTLKPVEYPMLVQTDIPTALAIAKDGAVWFTIEFSDALGVVRDGKIQRLLKGSRNVEPIGIGVDGSGNVWMTDAPAVAIRKLSVAGEYSTVALGTSIARLGRLAIAPDNSVWFAEGTAYSITQLKDGALKRHEISSSRGGPFGVAVGKDGVVWATLQSGNQLLSILRDGKTAEFEVPTRGAAPTDVAVDVKGRPWFIEFRGNKVGVLENGKITEYEVPFENAGLSGLAAAPDGAMWFGLLRAHALGRVRNGKIDVLTLPRKEARPFSVAVDDKGNVWYADIGGFVGMIPSDQASRPY